MAKVDITSEELTALSRLVDVADALVLGNVGALPPESVSARAFLRRASVAARVAVDGPSPGGDARTAATAGESPAAAVHHALYRHFRGGLYRFVRDAMHTETGEPLVVYESDRPAEGEIAYARPRAMFHEQLPDGVRRFKLVPAAAQHEVSSVHPKGVVVDGDGLLVDAEVDAAARTLVNADATYSFRLGPARRVAALMLAAARSVRRTTPAGPSPREDRDALIWALGRCTDVASVEGLLGWETGRAYEVYRKAANRYLAAR